ncbi:G-type lectin S-receptor-like serine/threonine-protein kinase At2g19130 [Setaria italica]|uniref:G-type lectin S-receptor-like serine/threonine-protein kinase At2g19130 n=1 Tax=Setaria italica TaxID=4555 RepID=UPI0006472FAB|nr:G-type lectin S-receptor-like serine/threonine-protein kinase At2g19130 [Setaria italica]
MAVGVAIHGGGARCFASDTISANSGISGSRTVVSKGGNFELGFFSPAGDGSTTTSSPRSYYVGIWYKKAVSQRTPVWVANRAVPVSDPASSQLAVAADGNLVLINEAGKLVWSSNVSSAAGSSNGTVEAVILDTGNLVLRREKGEVLWQSIEHPTDTWLPGVHLGLNKITGDVRALVSWKSSGDPAPGMFTLGIDPNGSSQFFLSWNRTVSFWSSGEWNGDIFAGIPEMTSHDKYDFEFVSDANASYFTYSLQDPTVISRLVLDVSGQARQIMWVPSAGEWMVIWMEPHQLCDVYAVCGAFGVCSEKSEPFCTCPAGFRPASVGDWELGDHSHGCRRNHPLQCDRRNANSSVHGEDDGDAFLLAPGISLPRNPSPAQASSAQDCRLACLRSCDCTAYSYGSRCALWYGGLLNLQRRVDDTAGVDDLYLRLSAMDVPSEGRKRRIVFARVATVVTLVLGLSVIVFVAVRTFRRKQRSITFMQAASEGGNLVAFKYSDVRRATRNFSEKLGGGGFGSVYKGTLPGGGRAAIAVKKLEGRLCVGEKQFWNEVRTIGVIQHVNLVRLRGFCSHGGERLLVYDHMPNGSLDKALFGGAAPALSWPARFRIALGTARGLLYLHEGCRDRIIHCDVKPENILLDGVLVPKVADFGMAKLVGREFSRVLTTARGTVGYLAPEWISGVPVTAKADVYSYGMVLLEIVSGRRNAWGSEDTEQGPSFSGYFPLVAARMVSGGEVLAGLLDERLRGDADVDAGEVERVCRVACWCVQDDEAHRPSMELVVQALEGVVAVDVPPVPRSLQALVEGSGSVMSALTGACFDGISRSHLGNSLDVIAIGGSN